MEIIFTEHAKFKLNVLKGHGFAFTEDQIKKAVENPDFVRGAKLNRLAAIKSLNDEHALRIIYEESDKITIVTIMVVKRDRYEI